MKCFSAHRLKVFCEGPRWVFPQFASLPTALERVAVGFSLDLNISTAFSALGGGHIPAPAVPPPPSAFYPPKCGGQSASFLPPPPLQANLRWAHFKYHILTTPIRPLSPKPPNKKTSPAGLSQSDWFEPLFVQFYIARFRLSISRIPAPATIMLPRMYSSVVPMPPVKGSSFPGSFGTVND